MKILHINDRTEIAGGVEIYIQQLLAIAPLYKCKMDLLGIQKKDENYLLSTKSKDIIKVPIKSLKTSLYKITSTYDIIHIHSISDPFLIKILLSLKPVIRSMHDQRIICPGQGKFWRFDGQICHKPFGLHCLFHAYTKGCCNRHPTRLIKAISNTAFEINYASKKYVKILVMSQYMKDEAIKVGIPKNKIIINPLFSNNKIEDKVPPLTNRMLFVGRLISHKGLHYAIKAISILNREHNEKFYLDVVGEGFEKYKYINLVQQLNLDNYITFHGWKDNKEVEQFIKNSFAVLFPSIYPEAFGIVGLEAMAKGTPVIAFNVGGVSTWLDDTNGILVKNISVNNLVEGIKFLTNKNLYTKLSKQSINKFKNNFTPTIHLNKLLNIYQNALQ